jgi:nitrate/nitrite-specific signal transduction histidine kinase
VTDIHGAGDIYYKLNIVTNSSFGMYLQCDFEQMCSQLEDDKADLQRQMSLATAKCDLAESKLEVLEHMIEDRHQRLNDLQASYEALSSHLEQVQTRESAAVNRVAVLEKHLYENQVLGSCGWD